MSSVATTNRASEMWNNCADVTSQSAREAKQYSYGQYPVISPNPYNYQNNYYAPNCDYSNTLSGYSGRPYGNNNQSDGIVKSEPGNWHGYPTNYMHDNHSNFDMINKWREMNYYSQQQQLGNYGYDQRINPLRNQPTPERSEDATSINSPSQCQVGDMNYGSPQSVSSNIKSAEEEDSPNLRALLTKPQTKKPMPYFVKADKPYAQEMLQRMIYHADDVGDWEKNNEVSPEKECNLSQFHGGFENSKGQASIKSEDAVGGAGTEGAPSSLEEPCQDVTRVEAGGDNADYAENKMAAASDVQGYYPWMKSVGGRHTFNLIIKKNLCRYYFQLIFLLVLRIIMFYLFTS